MKRTLLLLAAAALALSLLISAPAFSLRPYQPAPVDFELAPAASGVHASSSGAITSAPLRAPRRFDVLGLRWSGSAQPHVRLRVRRTGGSWSPWRTLDAHPDHGPDAGTGEHTRAGVVTDAAWAGHSDYVQYRLSRRVPGLRIHFVNTTGSATAADRARTSVRRFVSRGLVTAARLLPARAHAAEAQPAMVSRAEWGAADCPPRAAPSYGEVRAIFVHHTVTLNDYSPEEAKAAVLGICRYHRNSNGWNDIGYNFLVDRFGTIYEGRAGGITQAVVGAQAQGFNSQTFGTASIGTHTSVGVT
ncbi:MAG TPA: N-acetylmuramoyl-L-alanine amidase, partial [Gemmatimonadaceae bacterium]|nr:N-acetylmuramoyl-L-alanine amidase [Gemmatimonadaceae bacterium]